MTKLTYEPRVGMKVRALPVNRWGDEGSSLPPDASPTNGQIYSIRAVKEFDCGRIGLHLEGVANPVGEAGFEPYFNAVKFIPVESKPADISIFHQILRDAEQGKVREIVG